MGSPFALAVSALHLEFHKPFLFLTSTDVQQRQNEQAPWDHRQLSK